MNPIVIVREKKFLTLLLVLIIVTLVGFMFFKGKNGDNGKSVSVVSIATLEKIINVSELSTFTAVYNGVTTKKNEKDSQKVDYYVSYNAKVNAGIDFKKISILIDEEKKTVKVELPETYITDINVEIASLDFIFYNKQSNTSTVTQEAFQLCEDDVKEESARQEEILKLAKQNAINVITALLSPIIEQSGSDYTLEVR